MADVVHMAFTAEQTSRITGVSLRKLAYWSTTGFFTPEVANVERTPYGRLYSFRDLVSLRTISILQTRHRVRLPHLREVKEELREHETPWATLTFFVANRRVLPKDPTTGKLVPIGRDRQHVFKFEIAKVVRDLSLRVQRMRKRNRRQVGRVERHRGIQHNAAVVAGTRIPTSAIWNFHKAHYGVDAIIREYPILKPSDVRAAIKYEEEHRQRKKAS